MTRNPKNYRGTALTSHTLCDLAPLALGQIGRKCQDRPDLILQSWSELVGPKMSTMSKALSFDDGLFYVGVKNSTLLSIFQRHEKDRLLQELRLRFPNVLIKAIVFRIC